MKRIYLLISILLIYIVSGYAQTLDQKAYIDFGLSGTPVENPDVNQNYWNNATVGSLGATLNLVNNKNTATGFVLEITKKFSINGGGGAGGLMVPASDLLGDLAITNATQDYFFVEGGNNFTGSAFKIKNLDPSKGYKFYVFGSRGNSDTRIATYTFYGLTTESGNLQTTGTDLGGSGINQNIGNIFQTEIMFPDRTGEIVFEVTRAAGSYGHVNAMKIEEYSAVESPYTFNQKFLFDFGLPASVTPSPDGLYGNYWNNATVGTVGTAYDLTNAQGGITDYALEVTKQFSVNDNGGLESPATEYLREIAIKSVTNGYYYLEGSPTSSAFKIKNLKKDRGYRFSVFGSRSDATNRVAEFTVTGLNSFTGKHQSSGTDIGGSGVHMNNRTFLTFGMVYPDANGEISLEVTRLAGSYAHMNALILEEFTTGGVIQAETISLSGNDITLSGQTTAITAEVTPSNAVYSSVSWSVDDESIAWIDNAGVLHPKKNGSVTVTGTIHYETGDIKDSKQINISNQFAQLYFSGFENDNDVSKAVLMKPITDLKGSVPQTYEIYTSLPGGGSFGFYTSQSQDDLFVTGSEGTYTGPVLITVNAAAKTYTILSITDLSMIGSAVNGWDLSTRVPLTYQGKGVWGITEFSLKPSGSGDPTRFHFIMNGSWNYSHKRIKGTENTIGLSSQTSQTGYELEDIPVEGGSSDITLDLRNYTFKIELIAPLDREWRIATMGSSVANGQGAVDMKGYNYMYKELLKDRYAGELSLNPWETSNISVNGNSTVDLLARFEKDLLSNYSDYVIYGLSLGNEGIHDYGQERFDRFRENMLLLIDMAREENIFPVVTNSYTRGDFNLIDYDFVKQMNLLIHEWDVPSFNFLGAIDDGTGKWATGYQVENDMFHPTTEGHAEFFYAMVPSLFDALKTGKPLPQRIPGTSYSLGKNTSSYKIEFTPENIVHPFTLSFDFKTSEPGIIATFENATGTGSVEIDGTGQLKYKSPITGEIAYSASVTDNQWHRMTLTHYYAQGRTILYVNNVQVGELNEKLVPKKFGLSDKDAPGAIDYRELFFYRSAMNLEEVSALNNGKMLKSSLEIYAPLDENASESLSNYAQSTNTLSLKRMDTSTDIQTAKQRELNIYPNPSSDIVRIDGLNPSCLYKCRIHSIDGRTVQIVNISENKNEVNVSALQPAYYIIELENSVLSEKHKISFIKN